MSVADTHLQSNRDDNRRKKSLIVVLTVVLIAALGAGAFLFATKKDTSTTASGKGEVFLAPAATASTPDPFSTTSAALATDPSVALPASDPAPATLAAAVTTVTSGGQPGLYGATPNKVACDVDSLIKSLTSNADKASRWSSALNADPTLRWSGPTLDQSTVAVYLRNLTPTLLVSDTRLTATGRKTTRQVVAQKGTAVLVDKYGVPRVRCADNNPLTQPVPTKTAPKYVGKSWPKLNTAKLTVVRGNATAISKFKVRQPATPNGVLATLPAGPYSCVTTTTVCTLPSGATKPAPGNAPVPTAPVSTAPTTTTPTTTPTNAPTPPTPTTTPTDAPLSKTAGTIDVSNKTFVPDPNGTQDIKVFPTFTGYDPFSRVTFACDDSANPNAPANFVLMDANGEYKNGTAYCISGYPGFKITDHFGRSFAVN